MRIRIVLFLGVLLLVHDHAWAQKREPNWYATIMKIILLSSTYDDVIGILGKPIDGSIEKELAENVDIAGGRIFVAFSSGLCVVTPYSDGKPIGWNVPEWTVKTVSFRPKKPLDVKDLPFDTADFKRHPVNDVPGAFVYENDDSGISFGVNRKGKVEDVSFDPPKDLQHLHCR